MVSYYRRLFRDSWSGQYVGERPRVNCESVPRLPASLLRWVIDDPRPREYVFLWRGEFPKVWRAGGGRRLVLVAEETLVVKSLPGGPPPSRAGEEWVSIEPNRAPHAIRLLRRQLPRSRGSAVLAFCGECARPRRYLYARNRSGRGAFAWVCRVCQELRYSSEGGALRFSGRGAFGRFLASVGEDRHERPESWDPYVFSSLERAVAALESWKGSKS